MIIIDLDRQNSHNQQSRFFILLFILFGCVAIVLGLFAWRKSVSRLNDVKQQQILELQLKVQTNINKTAELDLIKNVSLKSLDVLRHLVDDPMEIPQDKVTIYNEIGVGEFGLVKRGVVTLSPNGLKLDVAVKMLKRI